MMVTQLAQLIYFLVKTNQIIVDFRLTTINTVTAENQFNALAWSCAGATGACAEDSEQKKQNLPTFSGRQFSLWLLNASQSEELEGVQRRCLQISLGCRSRSYADNMSELGVETLADRREGLVRSFAIACYRSAHHRWWFTPHPPLPLNTSQAPPRFLVPLR